MSHVPGYSSGTCDETGGYTFAVNPDVSRSYQDALILHVAESYYAGLPQRFPRWIPYRPRSDSYLSDPGIGVPTITVTGSTGAESLHHNSEDSLKHVDERSLRDLSSVVATFLYSLASATDKEIPWLAEITADRSDENLTQAAAGFLRRMATAQTGEASGIELSGGIDHLMYNADRDCEALLPVLRLATPAKRENIRSSLEPLIAHIRRSASEQSERLQQSAKQRASEPGAAAVKPNKAANTISAKAKRLIVRRKRFGPVTLDDLRVEQREGYPGFGDNPAP